MLRRVWSGRIRLWRPFWLMFVPCVAMLPVLAVMLFLVIAGGMGMAAPTRDLLLAAVLIGMVVWLGVYALAVISVWRSAGQGQAPGWGIAARFVTAGVTAWLVYSLAIAVFGVVRRLPDLESMR